MWTIPVVESIPPTPDEKDTKINVKIQTLVTDFDDRNGNSVHKQVLLGFVFGVGFLSGALYLVLSNKIQLSGPIVPQDLQLFHQRLEYVLRFQCLSLVPIIFNVFLVFMRTITSLTDEDNDSIKRCLSKRLQDSSQLFLMSVSSQMILAVNMTAEEVIVFCPLMSVAFFIGCIASAFGVKYRSFGFGLSFVPSLIAVFYTTLGPFIHFLFLQNNQKLDKENQE